MMGKGANLWDSDDLETAWKAFKSILVTAAGNVCGKSKIKEQNKRTPWWNDKVKEAVKKKKELWKKYLASGSKKDY